MALGVSRGWKWGKSSFIASHQVFCHQHCSPEIARFSEFNPELLINKDQEVCLIGAGRKQFKCNLTGKYFSIFLWFSVLGVPGTSELHKEAVGGKEGVERRKEGEREGVLGKRAMQWPLLQEGSEHERMLRGREKKRKRWCLAVARCLKCFRLLEKFS